ncbi:MAG: hypothetical protein RIC87_03115 [Kiloniellales bacterium]
MAKTISLSEVIARRSLDDVKEFFDAKNAYEAKGQNCIHDITTTFLKLKNEGAIGYLRELASLFKNRGYGALERCVIEEMIRRGFDRESAELRIFRSLVEEGRHDEVISYGAKIALRWDIRPDWGRAMTEAIRVYLGGTSRETALDRALFVLDQCGIATMRPVLESTENLVNLHAVLKSTRNISDKHRLIWNYSVSVASINNKRQYMLSRLQNASTDSLYDHVLKFAMEESQAARLALSSVIEDHPDIVNTADIECGTLLLIGFCCWLPRGVVPEPLITEFTKRDDTFGTIRLMQDAVRRNGEDGRTYLRALLDGMTGPRGKVLDVLGLRAEVGLLESTSDALAALELIREAGLPANRKRIVELSGGLMRNNQFGVAAKICDEESDCLLADPKCARRVADIYAAAKDWERAGQTWERVASLSQDAQWPLSNAYRSYAKSGNLAAAAEVAAKIDLDDGDHIVALPSLAHSACIIGMHDFARAVLTRAKTQLSRFSEDQRRVLGRVQAYVSGDLSLLEAPEEDLSTITPPSAIVIDPGFHYGSGHHFNYGLFSIDFLSSNLSVPREAVWLLAGQEKSEREDKSLDGNIKKVFRFNPYEFENMSVDKRAVKNLNNAFFNDLTRVSNKIDLSECQVIYVHSMKANMIIGFTRWLEKIIQKRRIAVVVGIIEVDYLLAPAAERVAWSRANLRGINRLMSLTDLNPLVYCETDRAQVHFRKLIGDDLQIHQFPYLAASLAGRVSSGGHRSLSKRTITFGTLGASTPNRGSDLFPSLVHHFAADDRVNWVLQLDRRYVESLGSDQVQFLEQSVRNGTCEWHEERLSVTDYYDALKRMDVIILPYRNRYSVSGSGVFYEAIQLGRFLIVPKQTFMGKVVKEMEYPCRLIGNVSTAAVIEAITKILERTRQHQSRINRFNQVGRQQLPIERFRSLFWKTLEHRSRE